MATHIRLMSPCCNKVKQCRPTNRFLMELFKTNNMEFVKERQHFLTTFDLPCVLWDRR